MARTLTPIENGMRVMEKSFAKTLCFVLLIFIGFLQLNSQTVKKCSYCKMIFQFPEFGGEIITIKHDTLWYDASECLASAIAREFIKKSDIRSIRSVNYLKPTEWIDNSKAFFLRSDKIQSPMSMNISAYKNRKDVESQQKKYGGDILRWTDVVDLINKKWFRK